MLTLLSQFQAQGWEIRLSRIRFAVQTLLSKIIPIASIVSPNRHKVGSEIDPALPPPTVGSGYAPLLFGASFTFINSKRIKN
jgi:hypothetical protein